MLCLPSAVFIARMLVGPSKWRQTSWLFYKRGREFELETTVNKSS